MNQQRIYLSPPHLTGNEAGDIAQALASNWVAPAGPHLEQFESALASRLNARHVVALNSGTAALHLSLRLLNLQAGDEVICPTATFAGSAFPILYEQAKPVFIDCDAESWNIDPQLLEEELQRCAARNRLPRAVIVVHLYGQCVDWTPIEQMCRRYEIPIIEDAAEALGATYGDRPAGALGGCGVLSFNGNKIITTSGGGALTFDNEQAAERALHLAQQAREPVAHYEHERVGFNYRMSNILAALGLSQLAALDDRVASRRQNFARYQQLLADTQGLAFMPELAYGRSTRWLTCLTIDPELFGATTDDVRRQLAEQNIEARPCWKPMHQQPVFRDCRSVGGKVAEQIFREGICLPSGSQLSDADLVRVTAAMRSTPRKAKMPQPGSNHSARLDRES